MLKAPRARADDQYDHQPRSFLNVPPQASTSSGRRRPCHRTPARTGYRKREAEEWEPCRWRSRAPCAGRPCSGAPNNTGSDTKRRRLSSRPPGRMDAAVHDRAVLLRRTCGWKQCQAIFYICSHCDRGHRYCSAECGHQARLQQQRAANRRYQTSPEGRLDHRDRQAQYRQRKRPAAACVTDHTSLSLSIPAELPREQTRAVAQAAARSFRPQPLPWVWPRCRICGRPMASLASHPRAPAPSHRR